VSTGGIAMERAFCHESGENNCTLLQGLDIKILHLCEVFRTTIAAEFVNEPGAIPSNQN
jgi:hypothetical protein